MHRSFRLNPTRLFATGALALAALASGAAAQDNASGTDQPINSSKSLNLPQNPEVFGPAMPSVIKATAMVNGDVITQTDVNQRLALMAIANGGDIPADQLDAVRQQVLRNLIDETLEIQAAKADKIEIKKSDIDKTLQRVAANVKQTPEQMADYLQQHGSSIATLRRQIEGELAWRRLQEDKIESSLSVGDDEVNAVLKRLNASKGTEEYRVGEIFLSATPSDRDQVFDTANKILNQLKSGASFAAYAREYSQSSTASVGGDLGWVRPEQLPAPLAAAIQQMKPGMISSPVPLPSGFSIVAVQDTRKVLTADPRDAVLNLKQVTIGFPKGTTRQQAEPVVSRFAEAVRSVGGCGGADKLAADFHGEVVQSDQVKLRDLPPALQEIMLPMQVGQATPPFGGLEEGVRTLVICGRDEVSPSTPTFDDIYNQLSDERVTARSNRYLADLRRDAIIEYR